MPELHTLATLDMVLVIVALSFNLLIKHKRLNDYFIVVRYPFSHFIYLFQSVRHKQNQCYIPYAKARDNYLSQMQAAFEQLPPGMYKTVTQPLFTWVISRDPRIQILCKKPAYHKNIKKLMKKIYRFTPVTRKPFKQFYYLQFIKKS